MIVFDLACRAADHRFEGWFASSDDFAAQQSRGLVNCPQCGSADVAKAPMAPRLGRKGNREALPVPTNPPSPAGTPAAKAPDSAVPAAPQPAPPQPLALSPEAAAVMHTLLQMQAKALKSSSWVGDKFASDARAMHYGEKDASPIHGQASPQEARDLLEEGIEIAPILFPIAGPAQVN